MLYEEDESKDLQVNNNKAEQSVELALIERKSELPPISSVR